MVVVAVAVFVVVFVVGLVVLVVVVVDRKPIFKVMSEGCLEGVWRVSMGCLNGNLVSQDL